MQRCLDSGIDGWRRHLLLNQYVQLGDLGTRVSNVRVRGVDVGGWESGTGVLH